MDAERLLMQGIGAPAAIPPSNPIGGDIVVIDSPNSPGRPRVDLRSAASGAAIELNNIRLKRKNKTSSIEQLIEVLAAGVPAQEHRDQPMNLITPTVVVMNRVVRNSKPDATIFEIVSDLEAFLEGLKRVVSQPASAGDTENGEIEQLQLKCLDISRFAASLVRPAIASHRNPKTP